MRKIIIMLGILSFGLTASASSLVIQPEDGSVGLKVTCDQDSTLISSLRSFVTSHLSDKISHDSFTDHFSKGINRLKYSILDGGVVELEVSFYSFHLASKTSRNRRFIIMRSAPCTISEL